MPPSSRPVDMSGRVVVVTGATSGIGREVARGVARAGATTVVVGRGEGRAARAAEEIGRETGNPHVRSVRVDDLAVQAQVRALAEGLLAGFPAIHVLVNNAGAYFHRREVTPDGLERTFALNVLAPYVLSTLLLPRLRASAPARIVNVSSAAHQGARVDFADLQSSARYSGFSVYGSSKLELIWLTREFARRLSGTGVTVNAVHPGFVRSGFARNNGGAVAAGVRVASLFARSIRRGADTPFYLATAPEVDSVTGAYFSDRTQRPGSAESNDMAKARQLMDACARFSGVAAVSGGSATA
jgi:NAD(P)-dependent dehydrogenase (short-subunit alcohol dehydrogenase family)